MDGIHLGKHVTMEPHLLVTVMGRFKGEDGDRIYLLPLVNLTSSGIRIRMWLERLVALFKEEGKTNSPDLCDIEGCMLSTAAVEIKFHQVLEDIQIHWDINLSDSITRGLNI